MSNTIETTDEELAQIISAQSYRDRMDFSGWLASEIAEKLDGEHSEYKITQQDIAELLGLWADGILDADA
jgi:predicted amidophosphoribosyltransferase